MAATTTTKSSTKSTKTATKTVAAPSVKEEAVDTITTEVSEVKPTKKKFSDIDVHQYIPVRNGFSGRLVFRSHKNGEEFYWDNFGDEQDIELTMLRDAKSSAKGFFIKNWFMFDDEYDWVIDYLGMRQYYKDSLKIEELDGIFDMSPSEIMDVVSKMPDGQKKSLVYRAHAKIVDGEIDSNKVISALSDALGVELVEK